MANISIIRSHPLDADQAHAAVEEFAVRLGKELNAVYHWEGECLKFQCPGAEGGIALLPGQVAITVGLSWLLTPAKGRIERSIDSYLDEALAAGR